MNGLSLVSDSDSFDLSINNPLNADAYSMIGKIIRALNDRLEELGDPITIMRECKGTPFWILGLLADSDGIPRNDAWLEYYSCYSKESVKKAIKYLVEKKLIKKTSFGWVLNNDRPIKPTEMSDDNFSLCRYKKHQISADDRWRVWKRDNFTCQKCGAREHLTIDHIIPEAKGGESNFNNYQTLCKKCNSQKGCQ